MRAAGRGLQCAMQDPACSRRVQHPAVNTWREAKLELPAAVSLAAGEHRTRTVVSGDPGVSAGYGFVAQIDDVAAQLHRRSRAILRLRGDEGWQGQACEQQALENVGHRCVSILRQRATQRREDTATWQPTEVPWNRRGLARRLGAWR